MMREGATVVVTSADLGGVTAEGGSEITVPDIVTAGPPAVNV